MPNTHEVITMNSQPMCKKSFSSRFCSALSRCVQNNKQDCKYICKIKKCRKKFNKLENLLVHNETHKPFSENQNFQILSNKYRNRSYCRRSVNIVELRVRQFPSSCGDASSLSLEKKACSGRQEINSSNKNILENQYGFIKECYHTSKNLNDDNVISVPIAAQRPLTANVAFHDQRHLHNQSYFDQNFGEHNAGANNSYKINNHLQTHPSYVQRRFNSNPGKQHCTKSNGISNQVNIITNLFNCSYCQALFVTEQLLLEHETIHISANKKRNFCASVVTVSRNKASLHCANSNTYVQDHILQHKEENHSFSKNLPPGSVCGEKPSGNHLEPKNEMNINCVLFCECCQASFESASALADHNNSVHKVRNITVQPLGIKITSSFSLPSREDQVDLGGTETKIFGEFENLEDVVEDSPNLFDVNIVSSFSLHQNMNSKRKNSRQDVHKMQQSDIVGDNPSAVKTWSKGSEKAQMGSANETLGHCYEGQSKKEMDQVFLSQRRKKSDKLFVATVSESQTIQKSPSTLKVFVASNTAFKSGKKDDTKQSLKSHQAKSHGVKRTYECRICKRNFSRKSNLDAHMRCHTGERPFKCSKCGDKFVMKHHLKGHFKSHHQWEFQTKQDATTSSLLNRPKKMLSFQSK